MKRWNFSVGARAAIKVILVQNVQIEHILAENRGKNDFKIPNVVNFIVAIMLLHLEFFKPL